MKVGDLVRLKCSSVVMVVDAVHRVEGMAGQDATVLWMSTDNILQRWRIDQALLVPIPEKEGPYR